MALRKHNAQMLEDLKKKDIYSLMLFALYIMKDEPTYSTLSELVYILNKEDLYNMLDYYGRMTITIPTLDDFKKLINCLLLYQYVNIEKKDFNEAITELEPGVPIKDIYTTYMTLCNILDKYDFRREDSWALKRIF